MRMSLTRLENTVLTTIITPLTLSPLWPLLLVRLRGYIVNLFSFYFYSRAAFSSQLKSKIGNILTKVAELRIPFEYRRHTFNVTITHSPITLANHSFVNIVFIFTCSSPPHNTVYVRRVDLSALAFSLSSHRYYNISLLFSSLFIVS